MRSKCATSKVELPLAHAPMKPHELIRIGGANPPSKLILRAFVYETGVFALSEAIFLGSIGVKVILANHSTDKCAFFLCTCEHAACLVGGLLELKNGYHRL
jgi:hypothetical protein